MVVVGCIVCMDVDSSVLARELRDDLGDVEVSVVGSSRVVVSESYAPGMWRYEYFESFVDRVREFIVQYTVEWELDASSCNRVEGVHRVVLIKE